MSGVIALANPRRIKASHRRRRRVASGHLLYILNNPLSGTDPTGYRSICPNGNCDSVTQVSSPTGDEKFQPAQTEAKRSITVRDGDGGRKTTNMTVTTAPDGTNSYTQTGATSTRYADNGSADGNGSKPEQGTDNTGDIENEYNRDFRDPVRNALGAAAIAAQAAHDFADPCMGAKTSAGCGGAIALQAVMGPVLTRELKGTKIYTDKAGAEIIDNGGDFYRGARAGDSPSFTPRSSEFKVDPDTGFVKPTHGVSIFDNPESVSRNGFVPHRVNLDSVPDSLQIIQRGSDKRHFEIAPRPGADLTPQQFIDACSGITCWTD